MRTCIYVTKLIVLVLFPDSGTFLDASGTIFFKLPIPRHLEKALDLLEELINSLENYADNYVETSSHSVVHSLWF